MKSRDFRALCIGVALIAAVPRHSAAALSGTVSATPGSTVTPGLTSDSAGTLLATSSTPFMTSTGTASGTLVTAVYQEAGGTLDFYYQVTNDTTSTNCGGSFQPACDSLARLVAIQFGSFTTAIGYRTDGASLPGGAGFVNGTVAPVAADRESTGTAVGITFYAPDSSKVHPGQTSNVLVVSTNATHFGPGSATVVGGGGSTLNVFQPTLPPTAPVRQAAGGGR